MHNSLRHLGTDRIAVLHQHRVDPDVSIEHVAGAVGELVAADDVTYLDLGEAGPESIRRAHAVHPVSVLRTEYSLFERDVEQLVLLMTELGIGLAYFPLGRGLLTGTAGPAPSTSRTVRTSEPRWQPGNDEKNLAATEQLADLARIRGSRVGPLALVWLLAQGEHVVPVPGNRDPRRVAENAAAADLDLSADDPARIAEVLPAGGFGARYVDGHMPTWH